MHRHDHNQRCNCDGDQWTVRDGQRDGPIGADADGNPQRRGETGYQWQSFIAGSWTNVSSATSSTYVVREADEGNQLRVHVTSSGGSADSATTSAVIETSLIPTITPGIHTVNGNNGHVTFIVTFPEAVATVGTNDFTLFGRATGSSPPPTIASVSGSGASYTVTVNYAENRNAGLSLGLNFVNIGNAVHDTETGESGNLAVATNITTPQFSSLAPAGVAGQAITLGLADPSVDPADAITMRVTGITSDWSLNAGMQNSDGSWTVQTNDPGSLAVTPSSDFVGAAVIYVNETWTNPDGSTGKRARERQRRGLFSRLPNLRHLRR